MTTSTPGVELDRTTTASDSHERADRRKEPRYVPVMESAYLGWWDGDTMRAELGVLWNISAGGAAVDVAADLDVGQTVWLCVLDLGPARWFAARLVGREGRVARLQFAEPFPYELLDTVVWGVPRSDDCAMVGQKSSG